MRKFLRFLGAYQTSNFFLLARNFAIIHLDGAEDLVLVRFRDIPGFDQVHDVGVNLSTGNISRLGVIIMADEAAETGKVGFNGAPTVPL